MNTNKKIILAIETSCDETSAAVLEFHLTPNSNFPNFKTLSRVVKSQISLHKHMGGVVPETAARAHVKYIRPVVEQALINANRYPLSAIDYIAVTTGPGLLPSLMVGVEFAKTLSFATKIPIIPVNHMAGHLYSPFQQINPKSETLNSKQKIKSKIQNPNSIFPMISLIVSGGHTMLVLMQNIKKYKVLGHTLDDAAGEAFDKVAKMLKLPYPGGPVVSQLAEQGDPKAITFPRPMLNQPNYNFSFSGLKTAVLYHLKALSTKPLTLSTQANTCASFQQAVVDVLVNKTFKAIKEFKAHSISLSGGVAANQALRKNLKAQADKLGIEFLVPSLNLCTDNAEMIAITASFLLAGGMKPVKYNKIRANPNLTL